MKKLLIFLLFFASVVANAQFTPGQLLTAGELNSTFLGKADKGVAGAGQIQYQQGSTGSIPLSVTQKFQQIINVNDFGADPTGVTDSTTAITNAEAACSVNGCEIDFGQGTYLIASSVVINKQGLWKGQGASTGGTQIITNNASSNVFDITNSSVYIRDMLFNSSVTRTGGAFILADTTSSIVSVEDVFMVNWFYGIRQLSAGGPFYYRNVTLKNGVPGSGQAIRIENGTDVTLDFVVVDNPPASKPHSCVTITQSSDVSLINSQLQHCGNALELTPGAGQVVSSVYAVNTFFDNAGTDGVLIQPLSATSAIVRVRLLGCWAGSAGNAGIHIDNSSTGGAGGIDGVEIIGLESFFNQNGITINVTGAGNGHIDILGGKIAGNSNDGIQVFNITSGLKINSARIGPTGAVPGNSSYGIQLAAAAMGNILISSNDLTGNTAGAVNDASTGSNHVYLTNIGYNTFTGTGAQVQAVSPTFGGTPVFGSGGTSVDILVSNSAANGAGIKLVGNGSITPSKVVRVSTGNFQVTNDAFSANILSLTDSGNLSVTGSIAPSSTAGIVGTTTNDNANAGSVGEYVSSTVLVGSAVNLTSNVASNITSISLSAGDWDVWGSVFFHPAVSTTSNGNYGWINTASATFPTAPDGGALVANTSSITAGQGDYGYPVGRERLSLASTTTVYLSCQSLFSVSTNACYGFLGARRVR